jgi:hypothetical protein
MASAKLADLARNDLTVSLGTPIHNYFLPDVRKNFIFIAYSDSPT